MESGVVNDEGQNTQGRKTQRVARVVHSADFDLGRGSFFIDLRLIQMRVRFELDFGDLRFP